MGSYAECWLGDFLLGSTKNNFDLGLMSLFRDSDKVVVRDSNGEELPIESFEKYIADLTDLDRDEGDFDENEHLSLMYRSPVHIVRDRLQVLGYSFENCKEIFDRSVQYELQSKLHHLEQYRQKNENLLIEDYEAECEVLRGLTVERWLDKMRIIRTENLYKYPQGIHSPNHKPHPDSTIEYMLRMDWYGYPGPDLNVAARLAIEACSDAQYLSYDLTDLIAGEYVSLKDELVRSSVAVFEGEHRSASKILILTEGKSDARILGESMRLLYPHLADYYSFMQFDAVRYGGGAGNLVTILKAFAGAGVANRTIGLFDNDTAASASLRSLDEIRIPNHLRIMTLPQLDFLKNYPTIGPTGNVLSDINGVAASIELFLGEDVLRENGEFIPIQWTGYDSKLKRYQGEVLKKDLIQRRFFAKVARGKRGTQPLDGIEWHSLRLVFEMIFHAFDEFEKNDILSAVAEYYSHYEEG